jgi:hypothetical protein
MDKFIKPIVLSIKSPVFMDKFIKPIALSIKSPVFMDKESANGLEPFQSV